MAVERRKFITLLGGAVAWPIGANAQQPAMPLIGFLHSQSADGFTGALRGFRQGLKETGYVEGENVTIEYRWAENQSGRLPALAADLVRRRVAVIAAMGTQAAVAAKAATTIVPIAFNVGGDPVRNGLVASLPRPGGNLTGVNFLTAELAAKRLELLRALVPAATRVAALFNPATPELTEASSQDLHTAAHAMSLKIQVFDASTSGDINAAFAAMTRDRPDALFVGPGPFFNSRRVQLAQLTARHGPPAIYAQREHVDVGGLISYGANNADAWQKVGWYVGRILKGAKPADLPVVQSSKFELVINAETARMLGLTVPATLLATADEVIE
jgi:putative tryptophan/tyrosine transport system substrate-binding protein